MRGRPLVLIVTAPPWRIERAAEEIGDTLYALDKDLIITVKHEYSVALVYTFISPEKCIKEIKRTPPAYASRILPIYFHGNPQTNDAIEAVSHLLNIIDANARDKSIGLEVQVRGKCLDKGTILSVLKNHYPLLSENKSTIDYLIRIEVVCPMLLAGFVVDKMDRVSRWWRQLEDKRQKIQNK